MQHINTSTPAVSQGPSVTQTTLNTHVNMALGCRLSKRHLCHISEHSNILFITLLVCRAPRAEDLLWPWEGEVHRKRAKLGRGERKSSADTGLLLLLPLV